MKVYFNQHLFTTREEQNLPGGVAVTLSNPNANDPSRNYTVFAPNNAAFGRLGFATEADFGVLDPGFLTNTLLYHVSNGDLAGNSIEEGGTSGSVLGLNRRFIGRDGARYINGSPMAASSRRR